MTDQGLSDRGEALRDKSAEASRAMQKLLTFVGCPPDVAKDYASTAVLAAYHFARDKYAAGG